MSNTSKNSSPKSRRAKGDGGLRYIEDRKIWRADFELGYDEDGKRIRKSVTGKTKSEVLAKKRAAETGLEMNKKPAPKNKRPSVKHDVYEYTLLYLIQFKKTTVKSRTFEWYVNISNHIRDGLPCKKIENLTSVDIQIFFNSLVCDKSDATIKYIHALLNQVLRHAVKQKLISTNPMDEGVKRPQSQVKTENRTALSRSLCAKIYSAIERSPTYKPIIFVLLQTGIRVGEVMALRWQNVDRANMLIHIENAATTECEFDDTGKTISRKTVVGDTKTSSSQRVVPITQDLLDILDEWNLYSHKIQEKAKLQGNEGYIFPNQYGGLRSYHGFQKQFKRFLSQSGLEGNGITFHKFRHTFATLLMEQGTNPRVVQELLGHKDIETTLGIYTSVSAGIMKRETSRLAEELSAIRKGIVDESDNTHRLIISHE